MTSGISDDLTKIQELCLRLLNESKIETREEILDDIIEISDNFSMKRDPELSGTLYMQDIHHMAAARSDAILEKTKILMERARNHELQGHILEAKAIHAQIIEFHRKLDEANIKSIETVKVG